MYNTLIPLSHESLAVGVRLSRLSGPVELTLHQTSMINCRHRRYEYDGGIKCVNYIMTIRARHVCSFATLILSVSRD